MVLVSTNGPLLLAVLCISVGAGAGLGNRCRSACASHKAPLATRNPAHSIVQELKDIEMDEVNLLSKSHLANKRRAEKFGHKSAS